MMKKVFKNLIPYWWMIILLIGTTTISVWSQLQLPSIMRNIINDGVMLNDMDKIWSGGIWMMAVVLIGAAAIIASGFLAAKIGTGFAKRLRMDIFEKVESFSQAEINKFSNASLITRSTNDVQQIQMTSIMMMRMVLQAPIMAVGAIILAVQQAPTMSWIMWTGMIALILLITILMILVIPRFTKIQKMTDQLNLVSRENLTGLRIIRAFKNEEHEEQKFAKANEDLTSTTLWINRIIGAMFPFVNLIMNGVSLAIVWFFAKGIVDESVNIGDMVSFPQYAIQAIMSFIFIAMLMIFIPRAAVSAGRIAEILNTENSIKFNDKTVKKFDEDKIGEVEFREVTFSYPDADVPVLTNINFTAKRGETTAFIGATGSGKSTLINLIPRFYDATAGKITIGGRSIKRISKEDLDDAIGYIPQRGVLFSGTIESNIKYGANKRMKISNESMKKAAEVASADFINDLDGKFKSRIAQGGTNISGGQKQRISIARALAKNPDILIFDDSFSALDYATDKKVRKNLADFAKDKTMLIVAQRISTIKDAKQIIVLNEGKIDAIGTHYDLLNNSSTYREIAKSQFAESEFDEEIKNAKKFAKNNNISKKKGAK